MRIITGTAKGRSLKTPKGSKVIRPAMSQVREAIFSFLGSVEDLTFLDVFAGTGSLGLEALSRGAKWCGFVDQHPEAIKLLIENLQRLGFSEQAHIFRRKLPHGVGQLKLTHSPDIIFCDPPYDKNLLNPTLKALAKHKVVDPHSLVIVEHSPRELPTAEEYTIIKTRTYGQTLITTLRLAAS